uniref:Uncharacterized protein n=1 Tax=candidate division WOR-3 bacterium TaxID=2052148 RepID=A0A7C4CBV3_UNCW3
MRRFGSWVRPGCVVAATLLLQAGLSCLKPPALPQWDIELLLPAYHGHLRFVNLLDPSRFIIASDSTVVYSDVTTLDTVRPAAEVEFLTIDELNEVAVSDFRLSSIGSALSGLGIEELTGTPVPDSGVKAKVEPFATTGLRSCPVADVEWVELVEGGLRLEARNRTGLEFDSVMLSTPAGMMRLDGLAPGETKQVRLTVARQQILSPLEFIFTACSPGSKSESLYLRKSDSLIFNFVLDSVRLSRGRLRLPEMEVQRRYSLRMTCTRPMRVDSLVLDSGECDFLMDNRFAFPISLRLEAGRLGKNDELRVDGDQSIRSNGSLCGLKVDNRSRTNTLLDYRVTARIERSENFVDIEKDDGIAVRCQTTGLRPKEVAGQFLEPLYVAAALDTILDLRHLGIHGVRLANAELVLDLENQVGFPVETELRFTGIRDGRVVHRTRQTLALPPAAADQPARQSWTVQLTELANSGPDLITADYVAKLHGSGWFSAGAAVGGNVLVSSPLRLAMVADTVSIAPRRITVTQQQSQLLSNHLVSGQFCLTVTNRFPFATRGTLTLVSDSEERRVETLVDSLTFEFGVPAGRLDHNGWCVAPRETTLSVTLDSVQASLFKTWPLNARLQVMLPECDTVTVRASDYLGIDGLLSLRLRVKE